MELATVYCDDFLLYTVKLPNGLMGELQLAKRLWLIQSKDSATVVKKTLWEASHWKLRNSLMDLSNLVLSD